MNNYYFVFIALIAIFYVINIVKKGKFSVKESFFWISGAILVLVFAFFPKILDQLAVRMGIEYPPSLFFVLCILFLLFINFRSSQKIALQEEKIIVLAQDVAILESSVHKKDKK